LDIVRNYKKKTAIQTPEVRADTLRSLPPEKLKKVLADLGPKQVEELKYTWPFWARDDQLEPEGDWDYWVFNAGRGAGKTRSGAEWVRH